MRSWLIFVRSWLLFYICRVKETLKFYFNKDWVWNVKYNRFSYTIYVCIILQESWGSICWFQSWLNFLVSAFNFTKAKGALLLWRGLLKQGSLKITGWLFCKVCLSELGVQVPFSIFEIQKSLVVNFQRITYANSFGQAFVILKHHLHLFIYEFYN